MGRYDAVVRRLYQINMFHPAKLGLENMHQLHARMGAPLANELAGRVVHVAGTNGKGSVCWKIAAGLRAAGLKTGLFVSPHVSSFRERVQVNGVLVPEADVVRLLDQVFEIVDDPRTELGVQATFFEAVTAVALRHFADEGCDAVVLETGLGGRLDWCFAEEMPVQPQYESPV